MERPQARYRASQAFQTEHNLARQPIEPPETGTIPGETNILEMPDRLPQGNRSLKQTTNKPSSTSTRSSRKARTPAAKRKLVVSFRRLWETNQQVFTAEVQQLEAYVDRINQILAERLPLQGTARLSQSHRVSEQSRSPLSAERSSSDIGTEDIEAAQPEATPNPTLPSTPNIRRTLELPQFIPMVEPSHRLPQGENDFTPLEHQDTAHLEAEAEQMSQLLHEVDTWTASNPSSTQNSSKNLPNPAQLPLGKTAKQSPLQASPTSPPETHPETQSIPQNATRTADALRQMAHRERAASLDELRLPAPRLTRLTPTRSRRRRGGRLGQLLQLPKTPIDRVGDAILWIVLAGVTRIATQALLAAVPILAPLMIGLMLAPAAIAVYLTMFVPNAGFVPVYRLFLVMLGLLLGGKL